MGMPATAGWTSEDLRALPEDGNRYEIIDGELLVTPAPAWRHQRASRDLLVRVHQYLRHHRLADVISAPADVEFGFRTVVEPDLLIVPLVEGRFPRNFAEAGRLLVAIEILSPDTATRDRGIKRELYQREGVTEYWIVDLDARLIERWRPDDERPEVIRDRLEWLPEGSGEPFVLDVAEFFGSLDEERSDAQDLRTERKSPAGAH
jgi:Uma2 family endonuclease